MNPSPIKKRVTGRHTYLTMPSFHQELCQGRKVCQALKDGVGEAGIAEVV